MDSLAKAKHYHDQAEGMEAMAQLDENQVRRRIMLPIAELFYLLHDKFVELSQSAPAGKIIKLKR